MKSDAELQQDVLDELKWEPSVNAAHIGITAKNGVVTLTGHVPSYTEKHASEKAAKRVSGVNAVANELDVRLPSSNKRSDEDIAIEAVNALKAHVSVPDQEIKTTVRNGWVIMEGDVDWNYQRDSAMTTVRNLIGVAGVTNNIKIRSRVSVSDIRKDIESAFKRSAEIDARLVSVEEREGKVTLRGDVHSWAERNEAQEAAWSAPGVITVDNQLVVAP